MMQDDSEIKDEGNLTDNPPDDFDSIEIEDKQEKIEYEIKEKISKTITGTTVVSGKRVALGKVIKELTDEELSQSGVHKLIIDDLYRLVEENNELKDFNKRYYELNNEYCRLDEKLQKDKTLDLLFDALFALGGIIVGTGLYFLNDKKVIETLISFIIGLSMIVIPFLVKRRGK